MTIVLFSLAALALAYTWVGYPLLLTTLARRRRRSLMPRRRLPRVSVIVAAYNEAACISAKLRSALEQRYPYDGIEVIVVSDGSTDDTDRIVAGYPDPRVRLIRQDARSGKSVALNRGVAASLGDVLVFTDANALFGPGAIARLAAPFADPAVGIVSGQGLYASGAADARAVSNGYVRYEAHVRAGEAALGCLAGVDGAIYALRRDLYRELDAVAVNDLVHPIQAALDGYTARFDPGAYTMEPPSRGGEQEFRRHVRIIAQGMHIVRVWLPALVRHRRWRALWMIVSHRVLRWATLPLLATVLATTSTLAAENPVFAALVGGQLAFYLLALAGHAAERRGLTLGRFAIPYYFCVVSIAGFAGFVRFVRSGADAVWAPTSQIRSGEAQPIRSGEAQPTRAGAAPPTAGHAA
jgi:cellulose synthase/poly-beta-1,6-N-acetylglucosamine synthase-like glycosyltransferase